MRFLSILMFAITLSVSIAGVASVPTSEAEQDHEAEQLVRLSLTERVMTNVQGHYSKQNSGEHPKMSVPNGCPSFLIVSHSGEATEPV